MFIGIESPRKASLAETHKTQNEKLDLVEAIHKIQSYNLFVSAGMIVGFDNDDASIFDEQYEFLPEGADPDRHDQRPGGDARARRCRRRLQAEGRLLETRPDPGGFLARGAARA